MPQETVQDHVTVQLTLTEAESVCSCETERCSTTRSSSSTRLCCEVAKCLLLTCAPEIRRVTAYARCVCQSQVYVQPTVQDAVTLTVTVAESVER